MWLGVGIVAFPGLFPILKLYLAIVLDEGDVDSLADLDLHRTFTFGVHTVGG